jgi:hypothetical protein
MMNSLVAGITGGATRPATPPELLQRQVVSTAGLSATRFRPAPGGRGDSTSARVSGSGPAVQVARRRSRRMQHALRDLLHPRQRDAMVLLNGQGVVVVLELYQRALAHRLRMDVRL